MAIIDQAPNKPNMRIGVTLCEALGHYRQGTSESPSLFFNDPYTRRARNATMPYGYDYDSSYSPSYQAHPSAPMPYHLPPSASQTPAGYPSSYTYPVQGGNLSVPRTGIPFKQSSGPSGYGHPSRGYTESGYGFDEYSNGRDIPPPPDYPTQDPLRTPVRPRQPQTPNVQSQRDTSNYRDRAERRPRKKRRPIPKTKEILTENHYTSAEIMEVLKRIEQNIRENTRSRSDPGRRHSRRSRNSPSASEFLLDDIRSLDIDRQEARQISDIIRGLLDDIRGQGSRDSYTGTSINRFADSSHSGSEMHDTEGSSTSLRDLQSLESRVDFIVDHIENRHYPSPQQQPEPHSNGQSSHMPRRQIDFASDSFVLESNSATLSRSPLRRSRYFPPQVEDVPEDYDEYGAS
ncbi:hypothetical protein BKA59DRAFT_451965 [Fusarium tricinctum]|uniref:Uncharacterized protein n=1 Tax=Fusarium tricinctum TaxID=61284 RepID=A0A8K0SB23_9HYPO|nr:hypothetical protein BKA59DRAFT_451965 [Fusarium tricinctum]